MVMSPRSLIIPHVDLTVRFGIHTLPTCFFVFVYAAVADRLYLSGGHTAHLEFIGALMSAGYADIATRHTAILWPVPGTGLRG